MRVLFVASEVYPLIKTGGLADVAGHLPPALQELGAEVTVVMPAYRQVMMTLSTKVIAYVSTVQGYALIREAREIPQGPKIWLVDHPLFAQREGAPYLDATGRPWPDNALRFGLFCQAVAKQVRVASKSGKPFDVVHCNDWQTGLIPVYLSAQASAPASLFTIHNLAYQGNFPAKEFSRLELPAASWSHEGVEFYNQLSFMKGGLVYANKISTVSPTYAHEILSDDFAYGMSGMLRARKADLSGIINGMDTQEWNPQTDTNLVANYSSSDMAGKSLNKKALQQRLGLPESDQMLLGLVARLVEQKGVDLILDALPELMKLPLQIAVVGTGDESLERQLLEAAEKWPDKIACFIGYDEALAHQLEAGSDAFLMPSRFEPCGLNQLYSQAYGTLPIVTATGGLNDTVADLDNAADQSATGFVMEAITAEALLDAVGKALGCYEEGNCWEVLQQNAMSQEFGWAASAARYMALYEALSA